MEQKFAAFLTRLHHCICFFFKLVHCCTDFFLCSILSQVCGKSKASVVHLVIALPVFFIVSLDFFISRLYL